MSFKGYRAVSNDHSGKVLLAPGKELSSPKCRQCWGWETYCRLDCSVHNSIHFWATSLHKWQMCNCVAYSSIPLYILSDYWVSLPLNVVSQIVLKAIVSSSEIYTIICTKSQLQVNKIGEKGAFHLSSSILNVWVNNLFKTRLFILHSVYRLS